MLVKFEQEGAKHVKDKALIRQCVYLGIFFLTQMCDSMNECLHVVGNFVCNTLELPVAEYSLNLISLH